MSKVSTRNKEKCGDYNERSCRGAENLGNISSEKKECSLVDGVRVKLFGKTSQFPARQRRFIYRSQLSETQSCTNARTAVQYTISMIL